MSEETVEQPNRLPVAVGVPLRGLDEAFRLSKNLALASVMPRDLRGKPSDVLAIVLYGQELGLAPMQSLQSIYAVKGKPQLSAQAWTALARRAGHKVSWGERTDTSATVTITRCDDPEHPVTETFTIKDAVRAGLCTLHEDGTVRARSNSGEKLPWETYTRTMLANRAISGAAKLACPEVALGFAIEGDYDYIDEPVNVTPPEHHGDVASDVQDAEVVEDVTSEEMRARLEALADDFEAQPTYPHLVEEGDE